MKKPCRSMVGMWSSSVSTQGLSASVHMNWVGTPRRQEGSNAKGGASSIVAETKKGQMPSRLTPRMKSLFVVFRNNKFIDRNLIILVAR